MFDVEMLKSIKSVISSEFEWVKESIAINHDYDSVEPYDEDACAWCLVGAIDYVAFYDSIPLETVMLINSFLEEILKNMSGAHYIDLVHFNDHSDTKHADVMNFLDKAIETASNA